MRILVALLLAGCWGETPPPRIVQVDHVIVRPAAADCDKLTKLVGSVPGSPSYKACSSSSDPDDYWYCRSVVNERYADALREWIARAIWECTP